MEQKNNGIKKFTAILFYPKNEAGGWVKRPRKYRGITNLPNFLKFARLTGAEYLNLYDSRSRKFEGREWL